ncbi:(+)-neomenthol dehydrogenase [Salix suchowensis]|nr:(+)-neomenthol dehydrogenase [Salix suchowensis]
MTIDTIAVVTGANKGIGLEICRQLATKGVLVVLTARDEKRGLEAAKNLQVSGFSDVVFHQLDVMDELSIASLANFITNQFGRLDVLVNNAGIAGIEIKAEDWKNLRFGIIGANAASQRKYMKQTYEMATSCLGTNYYGIMRLTGALIPILEQSNSARIVNVSSSFGKLEFIPNEKAKKELGDVDGLTKEKVGELVEEFLEDFKNDSVETKHWPTLFSAYSVSKAALNAYTRILAKKHPKIAINAVCPGFTCTDLNDNSGIFTVEEGARGPVALALMPDHRLPSGCFFSQTEMSTF